MDPSLYREYKLHKKDQMFFRKIKIDLFKADIYSMGINLLYTANGKKFHFINRESKY